MATQLWGGVRLHVRGAIARVGLELALAVAIRLRAVGRRPAVVESEAGSLEVLDPCCCCAGKRQATCDAADGEVAAAPAARVVELSSRCQC